jgi:hypothetical protein
MGLFRRNENVEAEPERCPLCSERVPDGADECNMCGADLRPFSKRTTGLEPATFGLGSRRSTN